MERLFLSAHACVLLALALADFSPALAQTTYQPAPNYPFESAIDAPMTYGRYTQGPGFYYTRPGGTYNGYQSSPAWVNRSRETGGQVTELVASLRNPNSRVRGEAAAALGALGPTAAGAVPALVAAMGDPSDYVRLEASTALVAIGKQAVPALTQALTSPNPHVRRRAAQVLAEMGPVAQPAAPALTSALQDKDTRVQSDSAHALWSVTGNADNAVPVLRASLKDKRPAKGSRVPRPDGRTGRGSRRRSSGRARGSKWPGPGCLRACTLAGQRPGSGRRTGAH